MYSVRIYFEYPQYLIYEAHISTDGKIKVLYSLDGIYDDIVEFAIKNYKGSIPKRLKKLKNDKLLFCKLEIEHLKKKEKLDRIPLKRLFYELREKIKRT